MVYIWGTIPEWPVRDQGCTQRLNMFVIRARGCTSTAYGISQRAQGISYHLMCTFLAMNNVSSLFNGQNLSCCRLKPPCQTNTMVMNWYELWWKYSQRTLAYYECLTCMYLWFFAYHIYIYIYIYVLFKFMLSIYIIISTPIWKMSAICLDP